METVKSDVTVQEFFFNNFSESTFKNQFLKKLNFLKNELI